VWHNADPARGDYKSRAHAARRFAALRHRLR